MPRAARVCDWCEHKKGLRVVEDERHVILACGRFERERQELLQEVGMDRCAGADQDLVFIARC